MTRWAIEASVERSTFAVAERIIVSIDARRQGTGSVPRPAFAGGTAPVTFHVTRAGEPPVAFTAEPVGAGSGLPGTEPRSGPGERASGTLDVTRAGVFPAGSYEVVIELAGSRSNAVPFTIADPGPIHAVAATQEATGLGQKLVLRIEERPDGPRLVLARPAGRERPAFDLGAVARDAGLALAAVAPARAEGRTWAVALDAGLVQARFVDALGGAHAHGPIATGLASPVLLGAACGDVRDPTPPAGVATRDPHPWPELHVALHGRDAAAGPALALLTARAGAEPLVATQALDAAPLAGALVATTASERVIFLATADGDGFAIAALRWSGASVEASVPVLRAAGSLVALAACAPRPGRARVVALARDGGKKGELALHAATLWREKDGKTELRVASPRVTPAELVPVGVHELRLAVAGDTDLRILAVQGSERAPVLVSLGSADAVPLPAAKDARFWDVELTSFGATVLRVEPEHGVSTERAEPEPAREGLGGFEGLF